MASESHAGVFAISICKTRGGILRSCPVFTNVHGLGKHDETKCAVSWNELGREAAQVLDSQPSKGRASEGTIPSVVTNLTSVLARTSKLSS